MEFRLLGPVEIVVDGRVHDGGPLQHRLVLAALAAEPGRPVSVESLIDRVWDEPPERPRRALQVYISRIRRLLAVAVVRRSGGYLLDIDPERVDVHRFRRLIDQARQGDQRQRVALLGQALELWRGPPLSDLPGLWAAQVRQGWQQQYLEAVVAWALACLEIGDPGTALPRLSALVGEHPLVESLAAAYLRALYAAGRPAEALEYYATVRRRLADELGTDPGPELQQLHRRIMSADPVLDPPPAPPQVPRQLPAAPRLFTGRAAELADLDRGVDASTVVITAIDGMAGIGKTALAVHAAHRIAGHYPDGQLFIDLHGYTPGLAPIEPAEALDHALRALGLPGTEIPASLDQRAALYRSRLANQKILIVLDNAATETQVTPLLPGTSGCLVLVTSRRRLAGLDQTHTLSLDTLPVPDAVTLFVQTAGENRLDDPPAELLTELVGLCGRLPLAIRIAAARLRSRPSWSLSDLVDRLRDRRHRLAELAAGQHSVTAALDLSYRHLSGDQRQAYRLLGRHPGPDIDAYATAALLGSSLVHARRILDRLLDVHLLTEPAAGRYRFHDLIRAHAAHTGEHAPAAALDGLLDHYRHTASLAMDVAYPYERERRPQVPPARTPAPDLPDPARALAWLDTELPNLLAVASDATEHSRSAYVMQLSTILHRHLRSRSHYREAEALHQQALATARATGDRAGQLDALASLGHIYRLQSRNAQAADHYEQVLQISRAIGHRTSEFEALEGLSSIDRLHGRYEQADDRLEQALQIARTIGYRTGEMDILTALGWGHLRQGRPTQAADQFGQALQIARTTDDRHGELTVLAGLAHSDRLRGRHELAADHLRRALAIARAIGHRHGELLALSGLGNLEWRQDQYERAGDHFRQLLQLALDTGARNFEFEAWQGLGRLRHALGRSDAAITHHDRALALAGELGQPTDQARAHDGLAHAYRALNQHADARRHWQYALDILTGIGLDHVPDEEETTVAAIRAQLASSR